MSDTYQEIEHNESIIKVAREDNKWLGAIDIIDVAPVKLTIKRVFRFRGAKFDSGREENGQAVEFEKTAKCLILNAVNALTLAEVYGKTPGDLIGKQITLTVEKLKREFQGKTHGIRIK